MRNLSKSVSIFALGASLVLLAPGELPSAKNDYSFWAEAEAASIKEQSIRRLRKTSRSKGLKAYLGKVVTDEDGESTESVDIRITTLEGQPLVEKTVKKADWQRVNFKGVDGLSAEIEVVDYQDGSDNFNMPTMSGETTMAEIGKTKTFLSVTNNGDGSFDVTLEGEPKNLNDFCAVRVKGGGLCGNFDPDALRLGGQPLVQEAIEAEWDARLPGSVKEADLENTKVIIEAIAYGKNGEVLDLSTSTDDVGEVVGDALDYIAVGLTDANALGVYVESLSVDPFANATLSVDLISDDFGTELINEMDVAAIPYREFSLSDVLFIEPDAVVDQEYIIEAQLFDDFGNFLTSFQVLTVGTEPGFDMFGEAVVDDTLIGRTLLQMNEDGETFSVILGVEGDLARRAASANVTITPDDGGSEADPNSYNLTENVFANIWEIIALGGAEASEIAVASESLTYSYSLQSNGGLEDILAGKSADGGKKGSRKTKRRTEITVLSFDF